MASTAFVTHPVRHCPSGRSPPYWRKRMALVERNQGNGLSLSQAFRLLDPRAEVQRRLIQRLWQRPITQRTAHEVFASDFQQHGTLSRLNNLFQHLYGQKAILRVPLWNGTPQQVRGFWMLMLNPAIFDVPATVLLQPGTDVRIADLLDLRFRRIFSYVAEHPYASIEELKEKFVSSSILQFRVYCKQEKLHPAIRLHLPSPLLRTRAPPHIYRANPEFAAAYGIPLPPQENTRSLTELFKEDWVALLRRLAGCRRATLHMLVGTTDPATIGIQLKRINERCKELGLPLAVEELPRRGKARVVQMNNAFRQRFCLLHAPSAESLESYFSSYQIAVIRYMNEHPPVRCAEMARALGVKVATVAKHLHNISSIAKAHGLPPVRHSYSVYYLPSEFLAYFGLPENSLDAKKLLEGAHQKKLYRYLRRYPLASSKQIAHHLCVSSDRVSNIRARMNVRLQKFGFAAL